MREISPRTVVVALSGGVDSAVAAVLLLEQEIDGGGVTLRLVVDNGEESTPSPEAIERARSVCRRLGIPFGLIDAQEASRRHVVDYFIAEYAAGRTPQSVRTLQSLHPIQSPHRPECRTER